MNGMTMKIWAVGAAVFMMVASAWAIDAPHEVDSVKGYTCYSCHTVQNTLGSKGFNNVCLSCHTPSSIPYGFKKPFTMADFANPFRTYTSVRTGVLYQTSHNWIGTDTVPRAGALPPTIATLNKANMLGTIVCARCHSVHAAYSSAYNSKPFLRAQNGNDAMCLDCHRPRNTTDHTKGTHPVTVNYAARAAARPTEFYATPQNANPVNPTSAMKISAAGQVVCTTCHGVHFTDSNSRTFHNASSARMGQLSSAKGRSAGMLLRTDMFGATVTTINICTNCHKSTDNPANTTARVKSHNGSKNQNVQCAACHGGHVDAADGTTPNVFLVNRYMNISTQYGAVRNKKVMFQYTSATLKNYNKDATGVCLACHPTLPSTISTHLTSTNAADCNTCHVHSQGFSANCTLCHGFPPQVRAGSGPSGYAIDNSKLYNYSTSGVFKYESLTPHISHAGGGSYYSYSCNECHQGNTHDSGNFQQVFKSPASPLATIASLKGGTPTYTTTGAGTCNNVYCHSNGAPTGGVIAWKSQPTWANGKGTFIGAVGECNKCHDATPATNAHTRHLSGGTTGKSYICVNCHSATVNSTGTIISKTMHVNGNKDILFSGTIGTQALSGSTCANLYCHSNGKGAAPFVAPVWTTPSTGQCNSCHKATGATAIDTYGHTAHLTATYGPNFGAVESACSKCHVYTNELAATHVNGTVDVLSTNCTTNCHKQGIVWTGGRVTCESCHTAPYSVINSLTAPSKPNFTSSGHGQAFTNYTASRRCNSCHDANSAHISLALGTYKRIAVNDNTLCFGCHNNAATVPTVSKENVTTHATARGVYNMDCKVCHDVHGTSNIKMLRTTITFGTLTSTITYTTLDSFVQLVPPYRGVCQTCHTQTNHYKRGINEGSNHPTSGCLNCHSHKDTFAFKPKACNFCHGYPPAPKGFVPTQANYSTARLENYSGGGGAHVKAGHILTNVRPTQGFSPCLVCHNGGSSTHIGRTAIFNPMTSPTTAQKKANTTVKVDPTYPFNATKGQWYQQQTPANTGSCWNVSCHFQATPRWSNDK
ncbi:CxxxxCH/CxxCH domain-containing protein [Geobacter pickeringii]|uniref:Cytochrome C n=1 Tax=Geobacter pickeringii TaxID=345632 RepID=A0A0B5B7G6_9BACT|nr:CxxxxCH/CxxCH domain-containing protein [Geobacter pickeringii]AJE02473.1 cytochrome C [Geobacter pickeringii]